MEEEQIKLIKKIKIKLCIITALMLGGLLMPPAFFGIIPAMISYILGING